MKGVDQVTGELLFAKSQDTRMKEHLVNEQEISFKLNKRESLFMQCIVNMWSLSDRQRVQPSPTRD